MGNEASSRRRKNTRGYERMPIEFQNITDNYTSIEQVQQALRHRGLESSNLIFGIDFTKSNEWTGKHSFHGKCLHHVDGMEMNPYEEAISTIGRTLSVFAFGFGDRSTEDKGVFSFTEDFQANFGVDAVLNRYREHVVPNVIMAGPTSFGPIIREAIHLVNETASYHILIIIADGQVTRSVDTPPGQSSREERDTIDAIVQASYFPLSIVVVGVGDGPWDTMKHFDDCSLDRKFDNFQFVHFNKVMSSAESVENRDAYFALHAMMEIPDQYKEMQKLGYIGRLPKQFLVHQPVPPTIHPPPTLAPIDRPLSNSSTTLPPGNVAQQDTPAPSQETACCVCTFLNPVGSTNCTMCSSSLPMMPPPAALARPVVRPDVQDRRDSPQDKKIQQELDELKEQNSCPICLDQNKELVFQCGHQTCCSCGEELVECPMCRQEIQVRIKLYNS